MTSNKKKRRWKGGKLNENKLIRQKVAGKLCMKSAIDSAYLQSLCWFGAHAKSLFISYGKSLIVAFASTHGACRWMFACSSITIIQIFFSIAFFSRAVFLRVLWHTRTHKMISTKCSVNIFRDDIPMRSLLCCWYLYHSRFRWRKRRKLNSDIS
jgi:hypothetical protein